MINILQFKAKLQIKKKSIELKQNLFNRIFDLLTESQFSLKSLLDRQVFHLKIFASPMVSLLAGAGEGSFALLHTTLLAQFLHIQGLFLLGGCGSRSGYVFLVQLIVFRVAFRSRLCWIPDKGFNFTFHRGSQQISNKVRVYYSFS